MKRIVLVALIALSSGACVNAKVRGVAVDLQRQSRSLRAVSRPAPIDEEDKKRGWTQERADAEWDKAWSTQEETCAELIKVSGE